ncbi:hypothetical protein Tco_0477344 [Tanacetum coccineum]
MAYTSSGSSYSSDSEVDSCSKTYVKAYSTLKEQYDSLSSDYKKSQFNLVSYKAGLESVEARLAHYKKNEAVFEESINVLKLNVRLRDNALDEYKMNLEKAEKKEITKRQEKRKNHLPKANKEVSQTTLSKKHGRIEPKDLKNKSFANIQDLFNKAMKRVNTFVDMDTKLVKESSKKVEAEIA